MELVANFISGATILCSEAIQKLDFEKMDKMCITFSFDRQREQVCADFL